MFDKSWRCLIVLTGMYTRTTQTIYRTLLRSTAGLFVRVEREQRLQEFSHRLLFSQSVLGSRRQQLGLYILHLPSPHHTTDKVVQSQNLSHKHLPSKQKNQMAISGVVFGPFVDEIQCIQEMTGGMCASPQDLRYIVSVNFVISCSLGCTSSSWHGRCSFPRAALLELWRDDFKLVPKPESSSSVARIGILSMSFDPQTNWSLSLALMQRSELRLNESSVLLCVSVSL